MPGEKGGRRRRTGVELNIEFYRNLLDSLYEGVYFVDRDRRIVYWNQGAEKLTGFTSEEVVGSRCADNILVHVDHEGNNLCESGCPLVTSIEDGEPCESEVFLRHKDGHRVQVSVRATPIRDKNGAIVGAVEVFRDLSHQKALLKRMERLEEMALLDGLTRLANRRHAEAHLKIRLEESARYGWPFGVLFFDIDRFKSINDQYGHDIGDKVLKLVSMTLLNSLRPFDFLGRWGGEEFLAVVVNVTEEQLFHIADRARMLVEQSSLSVTSGFIRVTISVGATMSRLGDTEEILLKRADELLYQSKQAGRNTVTKERRE
jgi:diguanylate cyclase (GGDEF)-like protein/PAS domain S-box-containing protein